MTSMTLTDTPPNPANTARKSSFYTAMRVLPKAQRDAMFEIYSFCRAVDDIADDGGSRDIAQQKLLVWRAHIDAICDGKLPVPELAGLLEATKTFKLRAEDFHAVIAGMEMDVVQDIQAPSFGVLDLYCDRVASAVGRLSVRVFGVPEAYGEALSHHLGRAFQFTNILRDVDEDAQINRLYLAREDLLAGGVQSTDPKTVSAQTNLDAACAPLVARAKAHFDEAYKIMDRCPRASVKAPRIMGVAYRGILEGLIARGFTAPRARVSVSKPRLVLALLRYGLF